MFFIGWTSFVEKKKRIPDVLYFLSPLCFMHCGPAGSLYGLNKMSFSVIRNFFTKINTSTKFIGSASLRSKYYDLYLKSFNIVVLLVYGYYLL